MAAVQSTFSVTDKCLLQHHREWKATSMELSIRSLLILGVILTTLFVFRFEAKTAAQGNSIQSNLPVVEVDPSNITDPTLTPSERLTVRLKISNVTDLFGFDIRFKWNASILNYTGHEAKVPVENYPGGVLHDPTISIADEVNATAGTYIVVYSSLGDAPSFNGSGTVFEVNFTVIDFGECILDIYNSDLATRKGQAINHIVEDGYFSNVFYDVAVLNAVPSSANVFVGEILNVTVMVLNNGTTRDETFDVDLYFDVNLVSTETVTGLPPKTEQAVMFYWNTSGVLPGNYTIIANATIVPGDSRVENNRFENGLITLTIESIRDVAILGMVPFKTVVFKGYCFSVNVTLKNEGSFSETVNVTVYGNDVVISTIPVYMDKGIITNVTFAWNVTEAVEYEDYILNATADQLFDENDTSDNSFVYEGLKVVHPGDFDADMDVDIFDVVLLALAYGSEKGDPAYNPNLDVNCDGKIDIFDVVTVTRFYGYKGP